VDAVISEAGEEVGALPLVAHALVETWMRRKGNTMTLEGFRAAGGVAGAISQTADLTFEHRFDDTEKAASKRLFLRLVTPGEGTSDARRVLARSEIDHDPSAKILHNVVEGLTEARLLTVNDATVQIAQKRCSGPGRACAIGSRSRAAGSTSCSRRSGSARAPDRAMRRHPARRRRWRSCHGWLRTPAP